MITNDRISPIIKHNKAFRSFQMNENIPSFAQVILMRKGIFFPNEAKSSPLVNIATSFFSLFSQFPFMILLKMMAGRMCLSGSVG